jgi:hypothetical protein
VRKDIESARHLHQQRGIAITITGDHLPNAYPLGIACQGRGTGPALKGHFLRRLGNRMKVVYEPNRLIPTRLSSLRHACHRFVGFHWIGDPYQIHQPTLWELNTISERHTKLLLSFRAEKALCHFTLDNVPIVVQSINYKVYFKVKSFLRRYP